MAQVTVACVNGSFVNENSPLGTQDHSLLLWILRCVFFFFFHLCYDLFINILLCSEMSVQYYLKYCKTGSHIQYIITTYQINSQYPYYINFPYSYFFVTVISGKSSALKQCTNLGCSCELPECIMY